MATYHLIDGLIVLICFLALAGVSLIWTWCADLIDDWRIERERRERHHGKSNARGEYRQNKSSTAGEGRD